MAEFTPGPWVFDSVDTPFQLAYGEVIGGEDTGVREVYAEDCEIPLATCYPFSGIDNTANARLIAAAPDLYEICNEILEHLNDSSEPTLPLNLKERLNFILKKARGENNV